MNNTMTATEVVKQDGPLMSALALTEANIDRVSDALYSLEGKLQSVLDDSEPGEGEQIGGQAPSGASPAARYATQNADRAMELSLRVRRLIDRLET